ncbi:MAG: DUF1893 domain-containing protein [Vulcanimicrobiota bacterium]
MKQDLSIARDMLLKERLSLVVVKNGEIVFTSRLDGIKGLLKAIDSFNGKLGGASIADRVIGKAAALLVLKANIKEVYSPVISSPALQVLESNRVAIFSEKTVDYIENRKKDGVCPMEQMCLEVDDPEEAFLKLSQIIKGGN